MNLKDLSKVVMDSIQECIANNVKLDDVEIYMSDGSYALRVNGAQLRFSSVLSKTGILILELDD